MNPASETTTERQRKELGFEVGVWDWVQANSRRPGAPFGGDYHAVEMAGTRLREEQAFIRESCRTAGVPYRGKVFWDLYATERAEAFAPVGRRRRGDTRRRIVFTTSLDRQLIEWIEAQCDPKGPFASMNHLLETGFRVLQRLQGKTGTISAGCAFPADGAELFARYQELLKASS